MNILKKLIKEAKELIEGLFVLIGIAIFGVVATAITIATYLFFTPIGWLILIILALKSC